MQEASKLAVQRLVFRVAVDLVIAEARRMNARHDGNIDRAVIFLVYANATRTEALPPSLRAVARSLRMPFESTRRYAASLIEAGLLEAAEQKGRSTPVYRALPKPLAAEAAGPDTAATYLDIRRFTKDLHDLGFDLERLERSDQPLPAQMPDCFSLDTCGAIRSAIDAAFLRIIENGAGLFEHMVDCILYIAVQQINFSGFARDAEETWRFAARDAQPPPSMWRAAVAAEAARLVGVNASTARRRFERMVETGLLERTAGGLKLTIETTASPAVLNAGLVMANECLRLARQIGTI